MLRATLLTFLLAVSPLASLTAHTGHMGTISTPAGGLGAASKQSIETPIEIHSRYGEAYFFENPTNDTQKYINLGYASLNVFHYLDAFRAFRMASMQDADSVYAYVGLILAIFQQDGGPAAQKLAQNYYAEIKRVESEHGLTQQEQAWANLVAALYIKRGNYQQALVDLEAVDGDNVELQVALNWILMSAGVKSMAVVKQNFEQALKVYPNHAGANHFLLHIAESANDIPTAQRYGKVLIKSSLGSAHAQHMYGHTLPQTGQWAEALDQFKIAHKIHLDYEKQYGIPLFEDWHYAHNLDLMAATYLGLGNAAEALKLWKEAMDHDARAIPKYIGLALAENDIALAEKAIQSYKNKTDVSVFVKELAFLKSGVDMNIPSQDAYGQIVTFLFAIKAGNAELTDLLPAIENFFTQNLTSGGFDGWSHTFVTLLRLKNIGNKLGLNDFVLSLDSIEAKAKAGTL